VSLPTPDRLRTATLAQAAAAAQRPAALPQDLRIGHLHLGLGAFHRAHQALYTEAVIAGGDHRWGICAVALRNPALVQVLQAQDGLYSVTERHGEQRRSRIVGAIARTLHAPSQPQAVLDALRDPAITVVTLTVTEKGYGQQPATGTLDETDPDIAHDLRQPRTPRSTLGVLAEGLRLRRPDAPLSLLSCDNMAGNGRTLRRLLLQYAEAVDPALARHIDALAACPDSMVDRIVPAATEATRAEAAAAIGLDDAAALVCEPYTQWVIEDDFRAPRPAWERAGALLVPDVRPYQTLKLRMLNGSHSAIAYLGQLAGLPTVADVMADARLGPWVRALMHEELRTSLQAPAGFDAAAYGDALLHRFENPALQHRTAQIASDGTQKVPVRWLGALRDHLAAGRPAPRLEAALAAWLHYLVCPHDARGAALQRTDPGAAPLQAALRAAATPEAQVAAALAHGAVFGPDDWPAGLRQRLAAALQRLAAGGLGALLTPQAPGAPGSPPAG
jgi:fructuronate reductase